jgi:hypothetical protein
VATGLGVSEKGVNDGKAIVGEGEAASVGTGSGVSVAAGLGMEVNVMATEVEIWSRSCPGLDGDLARVQALMNRRLAITGRRNFLA